MRLLSSVFVFIVLFLSFQTPTYAAIDCSTKRCAECDECGYCFTTGVQPDGWDSCRKCLYPDVKTAATDNETLRIITDITDPALLALPENRRAINKAVPPAPGKYYTQLGCIDTNLESFSNPSASGGVLNFLLGSLIFPSVGVLAFLALIYGSFLLIAAQGEQMKIEKGKKVISGAIVGLVFTFGSILLVTTIGGDILRIPGFSRGTEVRIEYFASCYSANTCPELVLYSTTSSALPSSPSIETGGGNYHKILNPGFTPGTVKNIAKTNTLSGEVISGLDFTSRTSTLPITDTKTITLYVPNKPEDSNAFLIFGYLFDKFDGTGDSNIFIQSIKFGDKTCTNTEQVNINPDGTWNQSVTTNGPNVKFNKVGFAKCTSWQ